MLFLRKFVVLAESRPIDSTGHSRMAGYDGVITALLVVSWFAVELWIAFVVLGRIFSLGFSELTREPSKYPPALEMESVAPSCDFLEDLSTDEKLVWPKSTCEQVPQYHFSVT